MATKKKAKPAKAAKKPAAKKPAEKQAASKKAVKPEKKPVAAPEPEAEEEEEDEAPAAPKPLKPLTLKQRLSLIRIDPATGKCPHGLAPETCSFCMGI